MPLFNKVMVGVRDLSRTRRFTIGNMLTRKPPVESFAFLAVAAEASARAGTATVVTSVESCPDGADWAKLCDAVATQHRALSNIGANLLRERLVHALASRLGLEEQYATNGSQIAQRAAIVDPVFIVGLPRCSGRFGSMAMGRSGVVRSLRMEDTMFPCTVSARERRLKLEVAAGTFMRYFPDLHGVTPVGTNTITDDLLLHLLTPTSLAWGLLHGLDDYLYECLSVDQQPVYTNIRRVLGMFQWYEGFEQFEPATIDKGFENLPREKAGLDIRWQSVDPNPKRSWFIHSPFAILNVEQLHTTFPDMNVVWVHRALSQCVPSLCSALAIHRSVYFEKLPTETELALIGDQVLGMFSGGTETAVDYFGDFPRKRMIHWGNRDLKRQTSRVLARTCPRFGLAWDTGKTNIIADAISENDGLFRPLHDTQLNYFAVHQGRLNEAFKAYIHQFEEFAFESRHGIGIQNLEPLTAGTDETSVRFGQPGASQAVGALPRTGAPQGHFLQEASGIRGY